MYGLNYTYNCVDKQGRIDLYFDSLSIYSPCRYPDFDKTHLKCLFHWNWFQILCFILKYHNMRDVENVMMSLIDETISPYVSHCTPCMGHLTDTLYWLMVLKMIHLYVLLTVGWVFMFILIHIISLILTHVYIVHIKPLFRLVHIVNECTWI